SRPGIVVGDLVPAQALGSAPAPVVAATMRRHVYRIARQQPGLFATARAVAHPESPLAVREALHRDAEVLGVLGDGRRVLLADADSPVLRELGRLRELAFRCVGEGTGGRRDSDRFDLHYRHLVLWDEQALAIVGAYRLGEGERILAARGFDGLYSATLFDYAR